MRVRASYHQERLWFIDQFEAGSLYDQSPIYHNVPLIMEISGELDIRLLELSIEKVVNRHDALRTRVISQEDHLIQVIEEKVDFTLVRTDLKEVNEQNSWESTMNTGLAFVKEPFDLANDLLIKALLIKVEDHKHILCIGIHHIICDHHSLAIIMKDIFAHYEALLKNESPTLPELPLQYTAFSEWQQSFSEDILEKLLFYWKRKLGGKLQALDLPTDIGRTPVHIYHDGTESFSIHEDVYAKLERFCADQKMDKETVLMAVLKILLYKYCRQEEIVLGTSMYNRDQTELEEVVGPIENLVVLRDKLNPQDNFLKLLTNLRKTVVEASRYKAIPFDKLVLELNPEIDMSRIALFDVLFNYDAIGTTTLQVGNLEIKRHETNLGWGKYDLNLRIQDYGNQLQGILVYNKDYYRQLTILRLVKHYGRILEHVIEQYTENLANIPILSNQEQDALLERQFKNLQIQYPEDRMIHERFEDMVEQYPEKPALIFGHEQIAYRQLNERANQVGHLLRKNGVGRGTIVGILLEPSLDMICSILGILKAGGVYLPIDPDYPVERIQQLFADSQAEYVITSQKLNPVECAKTTFYIESENISQQETSNLKTINDLKNPAYVIYTSGTTGNPKGVLVSHLSVIRLIYKGNIKFDFTNRDIWTLFHSYCFDFSVWEMYGALLNGGTLVVLPKMTARNPEQFLKVLVEQKVTVLNQTPTAFYNLIDVSLKQKPLDLSLRYIIFGGEALKPQKLKQWKQVYSSITLVNMFGITEVTVHATFKEITSMELETNLCNIGTSLPSTSMYIMDEFRNLLPIGVPGEIYVGGDGVSNGYLHKPELTREKFIPNPYREEEILYRSGDLARLLENGEIEYLGRIDKQVKIRGFRIELGEIENQLLKIPMIKEAVVVDNVDQNGEGYLCAYFLADQQLESLELKNILANKLPHYMVPAYFIQLSELPITSNGKLDRDRLPAPAITAREDYIAPRNEVEKGLVEIWADVLHQDIDQIGINVNFFEIGGNSIRITKVKNSIKEKLGIDLPIVVLFEHPTIMSLAFYLKKMHKEESEEEEDPIVNMTKNNLHLRKRRIEVSVDD